MKQLKFIMFLFFRYYSKGGTRFIPYFSALCAVVFLLYIHIFQLLIIFDKVHLVPIKDGDIRIVQYLKFSLLFLPVFFIIASIVKKRDLENATYDESAIKTGGILLTVYIIISLIILFTLMFLFSEKNTRLF